MISTDIERKIFFLYPQEIIKEITKDLIRNEYEAYIIEDHLKARELLKKYNNSIIFINIDQFLNEPEWEQYIKDILINPETKNVRIGIISYFHTDKNIMQKYLMDIGIHCGYIIVKLSREKILSLMLKVLEANDARGKRRFIRAYCNTELDTFNILYGEKKIEGGILDISIAGIACTLDDKEEKLEIKTLLNDIQLILRGTICKVSGIVAGSRTDNKGNEIYVIMFDHNKMNFHTRNKIHDFIYKRLQDNMEKEVKQIILIK